MLECHSSKCAYSTVGKVSVQGSNQKIRWKTTAAEEGVRLETFVRQRLPHLSRRQSAKAIEENAFSVNGRRGTKGQRLKQGDLVIFHGADHWLSNSPVAAKDGRVSIAYEDADIIVVDKPAGIATHGFSAGDVDTLANLLVARWPELISVGKSRWEPGLLNRLDTETSGLVLVAKNQQAFENLREQFRRRRIAKKYIALVWGNPADSGSISLGLAHDSTDKRRMQVVKASGADRRRLRNWQALTRFRKLANSGEVSLLEIFMETGVMHQIRVHLAAIGHPIVGDSLYASERNPMELGRHFLHACRLEFSHPTNGVPIGVGSPLPSELTNFLERMEIVA
jgi:23S rRNA pseudouridine1911/1915/1917 synthase